MGISATSVTADSGTLAEAVTPSFEAFFAAECPAMLRLAVSMVDLPERAEEIVQDAFEKTLLAWSRLRQPGAFLRTAVVNGCRSELRRRRVVRRHPLPAAGVEHLTENDASVLAALARLSPRRRIALTLRFYADLPEADIAAAMGIRRGTVKSLISRGLDDLRRGDLIQGEHR